MRFTQNESCGKCVPCRIGAQKLVEIGLGVVQEKYDGDKLELERQRVMDLAETMQATSICGLGTVASNPLTTLLKFFPDEVQEYCVK